VVWRVDEKDQSAAQEKRFNTPRQASTMNAKLPTIPASRRIAVIGSGISGMTAAYSLSKDPVNEVHVYEAGTRLGGHTATIDVRHDGEQLAIDTGFIVFNDRTYPHFIALLDELGIASKATPMSFSVSDAVSGIEYAGSNLNSLFAQRRNLFSPRFLRMVRDILRFNKEVETHLQANPALGAETLGAYLKRFGYSREFIAWYLLPMGAAIWSSDQVTMEAFPLEFFVRFFRNHGLLDLHNRPQWRVIEGGSRTYIEPLMASCRERIYLDTPVKTVTRRVWVRGKPQVCLSSARGNEFFDEVVFACHSDQALRLLADPTPAERQILGAIPYMRNEVALHHDHSLLPHLRRTWSSWNVSLGRSDAALPALTYNMNILQGLQSRHTWCVTLNQTHLVAPDKIVGIYHYDHPLFTLEGIAAQQRHAEISGLAGTWYCGAWWRNGFHEDGVFSALRVAEALAAQPVPALALVG
jgi:predicted NAD/FAD-binding protein